MIKSPRTLCLRKIHATLFDHIGSSFDILEYATFICAPPLNNHMAAARNPNPRDSVFTHYIENTSLVSFDIKFTRQGLGNAG